ncbi:threonine synthase [uncultured Solobacterium sp.]|uniref:threonine synthase n=1 Tax=uncultured Solobacterium sp. TaxID=747375 RepID=UPI0025E88FE9|nr:threonine synthase [uncultured Solobacterium sp.]
MKYISTRNKEKIVSVSEAIIQGLADDGGLYTPQTLDQKVDLASTLKMSYLELAQYILSLFLSDFSHKQIQQCVQNAYQNSFENNEVAPLCKYNDGWLVELWHGPTSAFKDVALTLLPHLLTAAYQNQNENDLISILTATSGDTGKAAINGFADVKNTAITVLYPEIGVSDIQKRQMQTSLGKNVEVIAVKGNFDDCQRIVKDAMKDPVVLEACKHMKLSSANSINIGRLIPQIVYYFDSYAKLVNHGDIQLGDVVNFVVPSGNFGNILAGYLAKQLGLPIKKLVCASNSNNVLTDFIRTGTYNANRTFIPTISPSMDILVSSNLERLLFLLSNHNDVLINQYMASLKNDGHYTISDDLRQRLQESFAAYDCSEDECKKVIHDTFHKEHILIDPHTAVAVHACHAYKQESNDNTPCIVLSTASAYKFAKDVYTALTGNSCKDEFEAMNALHDYTSIAIPKNLACLKDMEIRFTNTVKKEDALATIAKRLEGLQHDHN